MTKTLIPPPVHTLFCLPCSYQLVCGNQMISSVHANTTCEAQLKLRGMLTNCLIRVLDEENLKKKNPGCFFVSSQVKNFFFLIRYVLIWFAFPTCRRQQFVDPKPKYLVYSIIITSWFCCRWRRTSVKLTFCLYVNKASFPLPFRGRLPLLCWECGWRRSGRAAGWGGCVRWGGCRRLGN